MATPTVPPSSEQPAARPDVLAYPSATTARYLIFAAALVCSGLFVGNWVHNEVKGAEWARTVVACGLPALPETVDLDDFAPQGAAVVEQERVRLCTKDVERSRAAFIFAGAGLVLVGSLMLFVLTPRVVERRRRLRPLGPKLAGAGERFDALALQAGVAKRVQPRIGPAIQRDAFSYGIPMSNRVALPPAVAARWRDAATFDTVVAHELAHVSRRDVSLAWLVRSIGYVMLPILLIPIAVGLASGDLSLVLGYSWRVAGLAFVVLLLSNNLLRSRENDADIHAAAQLRNPDQVIELLARTRPGQPGRWGWLVARHPTSEQRADAVARPEIVTRVDFADGLISGFLTALAVPLLISAFSTLLATFGVAAGAGVVSAALVGPILGASVGLALWREAAVARITGTQVRVTPVAIGVGLGFALGHMMSLGQTVAANVTGFDHPWILVIEGFAGAGATVLSAAIGELWADVLPRFSTASHAWLLALVVNAVLFSSVLWAANVFQEIIDVGGWGLARWTLVADLASPTMMAIVVLLVGSAVLPLAWHPGSRSAPGWLIEAGAAPPWRLSNRSNLSVVIGAGLASGLAGMCVVMGYRGTAGRAEGAEEIWLRYWTYVWLAAATAVAAAVVMQLLVARTGAATGLVAGAVAAVTSSTGFFVFNAALGGGLDAEFITDFIRVAVVLGFYGTLIVSVVSLLADGWRSARPTASALQTWIASFVVSAALSLLLVAVRADVLPAYDLQVANPFAAESDGQTDAVFDDLRTYLTEVVPEVDDRYLPALATAAQVDSGLFAGSEVGVLESEVRQPLALLIEDMRGYQPATREVEAVHRHLLATLESAARGTDLLIEAYAVGDAGARAGALREFEAAATAWDEWHAAREALANSLVE